MPIAWFQLPVIARLAQLRGTKTSSPTAVSPEGFASLTDLTIAERLAAACIAGGALGLNRNLRHKPAGLRTHALVALGSATVTLVGVLLGNAESVTRIVQGVVTGVGFLGAGVIVHRSEGSQTVSGLTTAASIWMAAMLGVTAGLGFWSLMLSAAVGTLVVLVVGGPLERRVRRLLSDEKIDRENRIPDTRE